MVIFFNGSLCYVINRARIVFHFVSVILRQNVLVIYFYVAHTHKFSSQIRRANICDGSANFISAVLVHVRGGQIINIQHQFFACRYAFNLTRHIFRICAEKIFHRQFVACRNIIARHNNHTVRGILRRKAVISLFRKFCAKTQAVHVITHDTYRRTFFHYKIFNHDINRV